MEDRYYQREAKLAVNNALKKGISKQLLVMATGTGKTKTAISILNDMGGSSLWLTHSEELIDQSAISFIETLELMSHEELHHLIHTHGSVTELVRNNQRGGMFSDPKTKLIGDEVGVIKADVFVADKHFTIASVQTIWRRLDKLPSNLFDNIIVDEAHYSGANTWVKTLDHFQHKLRLGLTATPYRMDGMLMGDIFDEIVYEYPIDKAIKDGYLCKIDAIRVATTTDIDKVKTIGGELSQRDLEETINTPERNGLIVRKYREFCEGRQFIAFCADVKHAMDLAQAFNDENIKTDFVVGDKDLTTDRKGTIRAFKKDELVGLTNCMVLTAGFDHPEVSCIIEASPTKSLAKYLQQIGRGTRLKKGQFKDLIVLDIVDVTKRHKLINCWELDKQKAPEDRIFISDEKREKLMASRVHKVQLETKIDERVNLLEIPKVKISNSIRMNEDATIKQLEWIERLGYDVKNVNYTKKMCSEIISALSASPAQIWKIKQLGYDVSAGVTIAEAKKIFEIEDEKKAKAQLKQQINNNDFNFEF